MMGSIAYTKEQENAIKLRDKNLIVSAAAGTGKTAVLVERVIRMILDSENPVDIDRMLVVTFTNAAAAEMKERIREALHKKVQESPMDRRLREQLTLIGQAGISTIHSFCSDVIKSNYHVLDIDPAFAVSDELESTLLKDQALENIINEKYEKDDPAFLELVDGYGSGRDDARLFELIKNLYNFMRSMPDYRKWAVEKAGMYSSNGDDFGKTEWGRQLLRFGAIKIEECIAELEDALQLIIEDRDFDGYAKTLQIDIGNIENLQKKFDRENWDECANALMEFDFPRLGRAAKEATPALRAIVKDARETAKKGVKRVGEFFSGTSGQITDNINRMYPVIKCLADIAIELDEEYKKLKNKKGILDYNDLEHYALECLKSDAGNMYREKFDEILVDEYQDINPIQDEIIKTVSGRNRGERNVFMVGDVKQSIYGFRQAMPALFIDKYLSYSTDMEARDVRIELFRNYRSRANILSFTNYVFSKIMTIETGGIDYNEDVALKPGDGIYENPENESHSVDIRLVCGEDSDLFTEDISKNQKEAAVVGSEIKKLIESGFIIEDKNSHKTRPVSLGDITILMRSPKNSAEQYVKQLKSMGIPVFAESDSDFFNEREIIVMTAFLEVLDNPMQDIPLLTVLRSSIFGFSDKELSLIRVCTPDASYYEAMKEYEGIDDLENKIEYSIKTISKYREEAASFPIHKLLWKIMQETGYYHKAPFDSLLKSKQANLRKLFELAGNFDKSRLSGLFSFIRYIKNHRDNNSGDNISTYEENSNVVRIMSVHKSKGLEFPVVILAGMGSNFNRGESRDPMTFDRELGFGPNYYDNNGGFWFVTAPKRSIQVKAEKENITEEMRILYVALTRAREKLVITGYVKNPENNAIRWSLRGKTIAGRINPGKVIGATGPLEWIMACLSNHINGKEILEIADLDTGLQDLDGPDFNIQFVNPEQVYGLMNIQKPLSDDKASKIELDYEEIDRRFKWRYGYEAEAKIHKKVSVTELKKRKDVQIGEKDIFGDQLAKRPAFMKHDSELNAAEKGILLHSVLAAINPVRGTNSEYVLNFLLESGITGEQAKTAKNMVVSFFESDLGRRMASSTKLEREKAFLIPIETVRIYPELEGEIPHNHTTLVQGVIDCLFHENDRLVIVDYKSDRVTSVEEEQAQNYRLQLEMYAHAVEKLTKIPVKERYVYFLRTGKSVRI